LRKQKKLVKMV